MSTIKIDGVDYPLMADDMDLDEAGWFYDIAGVGPEVLDSLGKDFKPKVTKALICLTVARAKPETPHREIEERIGKMKLTELEQVFEGLVDESPPVESSGSESSDEAQSSGEPSNDASGDSLGGDEQAPTGAQHSGTGADSDQQTSGNLRRVS